MSEVERLRQEARARRRAVTDKIGRQRRNNGANVAGSEFDPRRDPNVIKSYNGPQLRRYIAQMNAFMSRSNQFVGGDNGAPLPRSAVREYQRRVSQFQSQGEARMAGMADIEIGPLGKTVSEFRQGRAMRVRNAVVNSPYGSTIKDVGGIPSAKALDMLNKSMKDKLDSGFVPSKVKEGRSQLISALSIMGENEFIDKVNELSDYQFEVLWFGTSFADTAFLKYDIEQERAAGTRKERWQDRVIENDYKLISEFLEWAGNEENIPREKP